MRIKGLNRRKIKHNRVILSGAEHSEAESKDLRTYASLVLNEMPRYFDLLRSFRMTAFLLLGYSFLTF